MKQHHIFPLRSLLLLLATALFTAAPAQQQAATGTAPTVVKNSIDALVEQYSTTGSSTFTSVVERHPDTRAVQRVVKVLQVPGHQAERFRRAFLTEQDKGTFTMQQNDEGQTMTLICQTASAVRIYMLQLQGRSPGYASARVTIIVKMR